MAMQLFTEEGVERCRQVFLSMPTYDPETRSISRADIKQLIENMGYDELPTPEQIKAYEDFHGPDTVHQGRVKLDGFMGYVRNLSDSKGFSRSLFESYDTNKDGFISADEFVPILSCLQAHDTTFPRECPFEKFLVEADTNKDGKVSIDEAVEWVAKYIK